MTDEQHLSPSDLPPEPKAEEEVFVFPTTFGQKRLWFLDQFEPDSPFYNIPMVLRIGGPLQVDVLTRALNGVIQRHEILRTTFAVMDGEPVQVISPRLSLEIPLEDLSHLPAEVREQEALRQAMQEAKRPFNLSTGPLLRGKIIRLQPQEHIILFTMHHIISDGWSMGIFVREIAILYNAFSQGRPSPLPELPIQYADYALWQEEQLQGETLERQLRYWQEKLGGELSLLELPSDRPRPAVLSSRGATVARHLPEKLVTGLKKLANEEGATLFMVLLAAFQTLLYRYTGQEDISVGSPIANRTLPEVEPLIGLFINTLVFRTDLSGDPSFRELVRRVRETALGAFAHQDLPFEQLVEALQPERDMSHTPLFQVMFILQNAPMQAQPVGDLVFSSIDVDAGTATFDLTLAMTELADGFDASVEYSTDLFDEPTIQRLLDHFQTLLEGVIAQPDVAISALPIMSAAELERLQAMWAPAHQVLPSTDVAQLIAEQAQVSPTAIAVEQGQVQLSYAELNRRANQLAHYLQTLGVGPDVLVGISLPRSPQLIVGLLGILKAGGAYLPLDPSYPADRLTFMVQDAGLEYLLTQTDLSSLPAFAHVSTVVALDELEGTLAQQPGSDPELAVAGSHLAYIIYTSGSTGQPKGVAVTRRALLNHNLAVADLFELTPEDRVLQFATINFDAAVEEIFPTLQQGATLVLRKAGDVISPLELTRMVAEKRLTFLDLPTAYWHQWVQELARAGMALPDSLRLLVVGGEKVEPARYDAWRKLAGPDVIWLNTYGPTETTIIATSYNPASWEDHRPGQELPIGLPLPNVRCYVLDQHLQPAPVGVPGELWIGGEALARGYLHRPELTASSFLPDPFAAEPGARMYRTGDLVRFRPDGRLEYLGRVDTQVKIRGYRIEPGEVESMLSRHPGLRECAVVAVTDPAGNKRLVAYVTPAQQPSPSPGELRRYLLERLPEYMVPSLFMLLEELPLTPTGKLDRRHLPEPNWEERISEKEFVSPRTPTEEMMTGLWREVLGLSHISVLDDFFELGGHSLLATQLLSRIRESFNIELPLRVIFESSILADLAEMVDVAQRSAAGLAPPPIRPAPRQGPQPVSFAQQRLWFLDQLEPNSPYYNIPEGMRVRGPLDVNVLERCLNEEVRRHESLRTTFSTVDGKPVQVIHPQLSLHVSVVDLSHLPRAKREAEVMRWSREEARTPFVLSEGPLLRMRVLRLAADEHVILTTMHHIISDEWSANVFSREIAILYDAFSHGRPSPLPDLPIQYADFARWQREWLQGEVLEAQLAYWREQLQGAPALLELPTDYPRPPIQTYAGDYMAFKLSPQLSADIKQLFQQEGVTLFMGLLAAFKTLLYRYSGQEDIVVGTPIANRTRAELENIIGFFVNTLVLRTHLSGEPTFREVLQRVRETSLGAYAHQDTPFEMLVDELQPKRDLSHSPLFQVMFVIQNARPGEAQVMSDLLLTPLEAHSGAAKFDLTMFVLDEPDGLSGALEYNTDLFAASTIERMLAHFQNLLTALVAEPDLPISRLSLLSQDERHYLLHEWNNTAAPYPDLCVHDLVQAQVQRTPQAVAVTDGESVLTYAQLDAQANQVAHFLRSQGVGPDDLVGVMMHRTPDVVSSLLGVLKAGAAYAPMDPTYPAERIRYMIQDANIRVLLIDGDVRRDAGWWDVLQAALADVLVISLDHPAIVSQPTTSPAPLAAPHHLAYVIYTSGSTGRPKGVMLEHRNVVNYLTWCQHAYPVGQGVGSPVHSSISFDLTVTSIFTPLISGGAVRLVREDAGIEGLGEAMLESDGFSLVKLTPAHLELLSQQISPQQAATCTRAFIIGGEALMPGHIAFWREHAPEVKLVNEYGPTETAVGCCVYTASPDVRYESSIPIGRPIINARLYVLDEYLEPVPIGVPGELYIAGAGVGRGYLHQPDLTAERFLPDPFNSEPGSRMYRTGDLARHTIHGELEFLGRIDYQVKVRGFRIELGEIEANLAEFPGLRDVIVLAREDTPGQKRLVAYVRAAAGTEVRLSELREFLRDRLPEYMIPAAFVVLDEFPLTPNGKVDRKALPAPDVRRDELDKPYVAPRTPVEEFLAQQFQEVLGVERVGIHDNFFELGGDSLQAATFINRLQEKFQVATRVRSIFLAPTVAELAYYLQEYYPTIVSQIAHGEQETIPDELRHELLQATTVIDGDVVAAFRQLIPAAPQRETLAPAGKNPPAVFIISPPRSGSTLLRVMLAGHPQLFAPPELDLLSFATMSERRRAFRGRYEFWLEGAIKAVSEARGISVAEAEQLLSQYEAQDMSTRQFYALLQEWIGERLLVDKTPVYALNLDVLQRAEIDFENALYIHLVRNPYATIYSFVEARLDNLFCRFEHPYSRRELAELTWIVSHQNILHFLADIPDSRQHRIYYEDMVRHPQEEMQRLSDFLGITYHPDMTRPYLGDRMTSGLKPGMQMVGDFKFYLHKGIDANAANRWRKRHIGNFLSGVGVELARSLGYDESSLFVPPVGSISTWLPIQPAPRDGDLPLSFAQQRLWYLDQIEPGNPFYNMPTAVRLQGELDVAALSAAINEIVRRHETLRTSIITEVGEPRQEISPHAQVVLRVIDLSFLPAPEREEQAQAMAEEEAETPFYLDHGPLFRARLLRLATEDHVLLLTFHHIISDGWSMRVFVRELATLYRSFRQGKPSPLPELPIQYADFAYWQRQWFQGEALEAELNYWRQQLEGAPVLLELPSDHPRPPVQTYHGAALYFSVPPNLVRRLEALSQREGVTLFMTLLAAFQTLLHRYSRQDDICVGAPIANRPRAELESLIGFFVNTLVMRTDLSGAPSFSELLQRVRETAIGAYDHQDLPFEYLVDHLGVERSLSHSPLFQVMFTLDSAAATTQEVRLSELTIRAVETDVTTARFDLVLSMIQDGDSLAGAMEYNTDLFEEETIQRMVEHFLTLLEDVAVRPNASIEHLRLMSTAEIAQVRAWNATESDVPLHEPVFLRIQQHARTQPQAVAVRFVGQDEIELTYAELNARANQLGHHLRALGVQPDTPVGILMNRSADMIVALLGVMKAGAAYLPIDPTYPPERIRYMIQDAGVQVMIAEAGSAFDEVWAQICQNEIQDVERIMLDHPAIAARPTTDLPLTITPDNLAYIIYTSGSTGRPKGVMLHHRGLTNLVWAQTRGFGVDDHARVLQFASFSFDASVSEIFMALYPGGVLVLSPRETLLSPPDLLNLLRQQRITVVTLPPSLLAVLEPQPLPDLETVISAGEACTWEVVDRWAPGRRFVNAYGPTEATIGPTYAIVTSDDARTASVPIGRPIPNVQVHILDDALEPTPIGVPGELCIGGVGVARGYLARPDLTAEKFIPDPFSQQPGARLYRTGDLGRFLADGRIEYLGRRDQQVKVRGHRVELGEIEAALIQHPEIKDVAVVAPREERSTRLVAYFLPQGDVAPIGDVLREFVRERLPDYMIPSQFIPLDSFPLTPSGKVDRMRLAQMEVEAPAGRQDYEPPRTELEQILARIWKDVLQLERVGRFDDFFELGGDSIMSIQVVGKARQIGLALAPRHFFQFPTLAAMAAAVAQRRPSMAAPEAVTGQAPLAPIQHWFFEHFSQRPHHWNTSMMLEIHGALDADVLAQAARALQEHHHALRLRFTQQQDRWLQYLTEDPQDEPFVVVDLEEVEDDKLSQTIEDHATRLQASLNILTGPVFRVVFFNPGAGRPARLLFIFHHLTIDGISWRIILEDFMLLYRQLDRGRTPRLPAPTTSFLLWARRLHEYAQTKEVRDELDFWLQLKDVAPARLPAENPQGDNTFGDAENLTVSLDAKQSHRLLTELPARTGVKTNEALLTALVRWLGRYNEGNQWLIEMRGHGREDIFPELDISRTIGWFTTSFPVMLRLDRGASVAEQVQQTRSLLENLPNSGIGYGLLRYLHEDELVRRQMSTIPAPEISFNYFGVFGSRSQHHGVDARRGKRSGRLTALMTQARKTLSSVIPRRMRMAEEKVGPEQDPASTRASAISIITIVSEGELHIRFVYSRKQYRRETIQQWAEQYEQEIVQLLSHLLDERAHKGVFLNAHHRRSDD